MQNDPHDEIRLKKLKFRAWRRGFREADLILGPFADAYASAMTAAELDALEAILDQPDHDLYGWILDREPTPPEFDGEIMRRIKAFRDQAYALREDDHGG